MKILQAIKALEKLLTQLGSGIQLDVLRFVGSAKTAFRDFVFSILVKVSSLFQIPRLYMAAGQTKRDHFMVFE